MKILSKSAEETVELGKKLGKKLKGGETVALYGDLGGGKTQFTKGIAKGLGVKDNIVSPTFVIRKEYGIDSCFRRNDRGEVIEHDYKGKKRRLLHYDFYRFDKLDEELIESLEEGINKDNVTVIEWADKVKKHLPEDTIKFTFHYVGKDEREIEFSSSVISDFGLESI